MEFKLTPEYIKELFKSCYTNNKVFDVCYKYLETRFLIEKTEKDFWEETKRMFAVDMKYPTLGRLQVENRKNKELVDFIAQVRSLHVTNHNAIINSLNDFIKQSKFAAVFDEASQKYNRGKEHEAYKIFIKGAGDLESFSIKDKYFDKVFSGFDARVVERITDCDKNLKVPTFIDEYDKLTHGGPERKEAFLMVGESGIGKSQFLIQYQVSNARRGAKGIHFQIEGTKKQCLDRLDSNWTGTQYHDVKNGLMSDAKYKASRRVVEKIGRGEIYVEAFEKFGSCSIFDVRNSCIELKKLYGDIELITIDYLELMSTGDGINYGGDNERFRQEKLGRFCKELAMEMDAVVATVTQASNLPFELKKDPKFVMTRDFLSDAKGKLKPFDYLLTMNQTPEEQKNEIIRLYCDKMREYKNGQILRIATNMGTSRFYDRKRTIELNIYEEEEDE